MRPKQHPTPRQLEVLRPYSSAGSVAAAYGLGISETTVAAALVRAVSADGLPVCGAGGVLAREGRQRPPTV